MLAIFICFKHGASIRTLATDKVNDASSLCVFWALSSFLAGDLSLEVYKTSLAALQMVSSSRLHISFSHLRTKSNYLHR